MISSSPMKKTTASAGVGAFEAQMTPIATMNRLLSASDVIPELRNQAKVRRTELKYDISIILGKATGFRLLDRGPGQASPERRNRPTICHSIESWNPEISRQKQSPRFIEKIHSAISPFKNEGMGYNKGPAYA